MRPVIALLIDDITKYFSCGTIRFRSYEAGSPFSRLYEDINWYCWRATEYVQPAARVYRHCRFLDEIRMHLASLPRSDGCELKENKLVAKPETFYADRKTTTADHGTTEVWKKNKY